MKLLAFNVKKENFPEKNKSNLLFIIFGMICERPQKNLVIFGREPEYFVITPL